MPATIAFLIGACVVTIVLSQNTQDEVDPLNNNADWVSVVNGIEKLEQWKKDNIQCVLEFVTALHSLETDQPLRYVLGFDAKSTRRQKYFRRNIETKKEPSAPTSSPSKRTLSKNSQKREHPSDFGSSRRSQQYDYLRLQNRQLTDEMMAQVIASMNSMPQGAQPMPHYDMGHMSPGMGGPGMGQPGMGQPGMGQQGMGHMGQPIVTPSQPNIPSPISGPRVKITPTTKSGEPKKKTTKDKVTGAIHAIHEWREQLITLAMNYVSALRNLKLEQFVTMQHTK